MNDATALTAYQVAVASVATTLTVADVAARFVFAVVVGVGIGLAVGLDRHPAAATLETPVIENTVLLILPFAAYLPVRQARRLGRARRRGLRPLLRPLRLAVADRRRPAPATPDLGAHRLPADRPLVPAGRPRAAAGARVADRPRTRAPWSSSRWPSSGAVVVLRMAWMFGVTALPGGRHLFSTNQGTPSTWRETTVVGWAGMRGAISLAAALALPTSFAERDLVLFLTFAVIVATLVGQGLTLPPLIRRLGLVSRGRAGPGPGGRGPAGGSSCSPSTASTTWPSPRERPTR